MPSKDVIWGVELWGKSLVARWRTIKDDAGVAMFAYDFDKLPATIEKTPCALSFISEAVDLDYSLGGANTARWKGKTEFHLTTSLAMTRLNYLNQFYRKIADAAAGKFYLEGNAEFKLVNSGSLKPTTLIYGGDETTEHYGIICYWEIFESITNKIAVKI